MQIKINCNNSNAHVVIDMGHLFLQYIHPYTPTGQQSSKSTPNLPQVSHTVV